MSVKATVTSIHSSRASDSTVTRTSNERIHVDVTNGIESVEVIVRADGRISIEVKSGALITQFLNLAQGYAVAPGQTIVDGVAR